MGKIIDKTKSEIYNIIVDGKEEQATGYEITYHMGYRPTHNFGGKQFTFEEMETLGINAMMVEPNCRHRKFPVVVGVSKPRLDPDELKRLEEIEFAKYNFNGRKYNLYELMQLQRRYEREMRENFNETLRFQTWDRLRSQVHAKRFETQLDKYFDLTEMMFDVTGRADDMFDFLGDLFSQDGVEESFGKGFLCASEQLDDRLKTASLSMAGVQRTAPSSPLDNKISEIIMRVKEKIAEIEAKIAELSTNLPQTKPNSPLSPIPEPDWVRTENGNLVTKQSLIDLKMNHINDSSVDELNRILTKYGITAKEDIAMFLATCAHESKTGLVEVGVGNTYVINGVDFRGSGFIQLTGRSNYQAFADQMLKEGLIQLDTSGNNPIMSGGAQYIADNFAWESAAWFWTVSWNDCSRKIANGASFYTISQIVNGGPSRAGTNFVPNGISDRNEFYEQAKQIFGIGG